MTKKNKIIILAAAAVLVLAVIIGIVIAATSDKGQENYELKSDYAYTVKEMENGTVKLTLSKRGCRKGSWRCDLDEEAAVNVAVKNGRKDVFTVSEKDGESTEALTFILNDGEQDVYRIHFTATVDNINRVSLSGVSASPIFGDLTVSDGGNLRAYCSSKDTGYLNVTVPCAGSDEWSFDAAENTQIEIGEYFEGCRRLAVYATEKGEYTVTLKNTTQGYNVVLNIIAEKDTTVQIAGGEITGKTTAAVSADSAA